MDWTCPLIDWTCPLKGKFDDAGLSRPANASDEVGSAGEGLGTISYTAPEIFQDDSAKKTTASDVYAFGILRELSLILPSV